MQLTTPMADPVANPTTMTDTAKLTEWIDGLPSANPAATAKLLCNALSLLNRHPDIVANRLQLMRCYLPPFINLLKAHIKHGKTQPPGSKSKKELERQQLTEKIINEMSFGFKSIINESMNFSDEKHTADSQAEIIYYAIECLVLALMCCYADYRIAPRNTYKEILQLNMLAEKLGVSKIAVESQLHRAETPANVRLAFKRILLLQLLDPSHLQMGEIWFAYDYLSWWGGHARIVRIPEQIDNPTGRFLIDLSGDSRIETYDPENRPEQSNRYLLLDALPLNAVVNKHLQSQSEKQAPPIPGFRSNPNLPAAILLRHMLLAWHICPKRRHERQEQYDWLVAAAGITQVHHYLEQKHLVAKSDPSSLGLEDSSEEVEITGAIGGGITAAPSTFRWRQINTSASGAALIIHPDEKTNLQVGQIVLMQSEQSATGNSTPLAAIVRRMVKKDASTLEVGVQYVQGSLSPASIRPVVFGMVEERADFQPALFLDRGESQLGVLFTPHLIYHPKQEYITEFESGETQRVFAERLLETTRSFERFEFKTINLKAEES